MAVLTGFTYNSPIPRMKGTSIIHIIHAFIEMEWNDSLGSKKTPYTKISRNSLYQAHKITRPIVD